MDVIRSIRPGNPGSHRYLDEWGDKLVAVRYRKSSEGGALYTTIEIIVDERLASPATHRILQMSGRNRAVAIRVHFEEHELRHKVKAAGAKWSPNSGSG